MQFQSPVKIRIGEPYLDALADEVGDRSWLLITSRGWTDRRLVDEMIVRLGRPVMVVDHVEPNPLLSSVLAMGREAPRAEVIVAAGGGSVLDAAKGIAAVHALGPEAPDQIARHLKGETLLPRGFAPPPIVAVPTTSGTGSEVTRWATIWGDDRRKYSIEDAALYPVAAILDPGLTMTMPRDVTLASGLDALSHAFEAVWNRSHTVLTDLMASAAIDLIVRNLREAVLQPQSRRRREAMQTASLMAGMAMANTRTALAHSISYPFTAELGLPHGLACSFTLAEVARFNFETHEMRLQPIAKGFGCDLAEVPERIEALLKGLGVGEALRRYLPADPVGVIKGELITPSRAGNNVRPPDAASARALAERAHATLSGDRPIVEAAERGR